MQIFDFIAQEELDDLPEDDSAAFLEFVRIARGRLQNRFNQLNSNDENDYDNFQDARHGFINVVTATARRLKIEPFASMDVPRIKNLSYEDYRQFTADLDHYMTQMLFDSRLSRRKESVELSDNAKMSIRTRLHHLREILEKSDYDERTKARLRARLEDFEKDLEGRRINYFAVTRLAIEILAAPGALAASYDISAKLINQIMQTIGVEKINEDERRRLPPVEKPAALMPPRVEEKKIGGRFESFNDDSDIPF